MAHIKDNSATSQIRLAILSTKEIYANFNVRESIGNQQRHSLVLIHWIDHAAYVLHTDPRTNMLEYTR